MSLHHRGVLAAELGLLLWGIAMGFGSLRGHGYAIPIYWTGLFLLLGLFAMIAGVAWETLLENRLISKAGLRVLNRHAHQGCRSAQALLQRTAHPTWGEAFHAEMLCRKGHLHHE